MPSQRPLETNAVGIRQLKAQLRQHLRRVEAGETLQVTDRGRVIATISPAAPPGDEHPAAEWARALVAAGKASWSCRRFTPPQRTVKLRGTATLSDAVIEDRR